MFGARKQDDEFRDTVWLNGPDAGQPVRRGVSRHKVYKVDHEAAQLEIGSKQLSELDHVSMLEKREAYAKQVADRAKADLEIARLVKSNQWLLGAQQRQPLRWPVWTALGFGVLILLLLVTREVREWLRPDPTLPRSSVAESAPEQLSEPPPERPVRQGRVASRDIKRIANVY
jgi:uncharacterized membrane protein YcjF (UPF0283 family)